MLLLVAQQALQWCNCYYSSLCVIISAFLQGRGARDKSAPGRQRRSTEWCQCVSVVASPLTDQIVRMRGESVMATFPVRCRDVTDAAGGTATLHLGGKKTRSCWWFEPASKSGIWEQRAGGERNMETKAKKVQTDLFGLYVVGFGFHPVALVNQ